VSGGAEDMLVEYCTNCGRGYDVYDGWNGTDITCHRRPYDNMFDCPYCKKNSLYARKKKVWFDKNDIIKKVADYDMKEDIPSVTVRKGENIFEAEARLKKERERLSKRKKDYRLIEVYEAQVSDEDLQILDKLSKEGYNPVRLDKKDYLRITGRRDVSSSFLYDFINSKGKKIMVTWEEDKRFGDKKKVQ